MIICTTGLQQGDPLASLAFSLSIHPTITSISSEFNGWYQDDGTLGGNLEQVSNDLQALQRKLLQICLQFNPRKPEVTVIDAPTLSSHNYVITRISDMLPGKVEVPFDSMWLPGLAKGDENLGTSIARCTRRVELICQCVRNLDPHWALLFLTHYTSAPR